MLTQSIASEAVAQLFTEARTHKSFENKAVPEQMLEQIYN